MKVLKIGRVDNLKEERWRDFLSVFEQVNVFVLSYEIQGKEKKTLVKNDKIKYYSFDLENRINKWIWDKINSFKVDKSKNILTQALIFLLRINNFRLINSLIKQDYDYIHSGFGDHDDSDMLTILLKPFLKAPIIRVYKETRPGYNYCEKKCFEISDTIALTGKDAKLFFEDKYGSNFFKGKKIVLNYDENCMSSILKERIHYQVKYSEEDHLKHIVILAGRVFSDSADPRSGARLCYIPIIRELMNNDFVVHLHTKRIFKDSHGINQYLNLKQQYPSKFFIERPLDFDKDTVQSLEILSKYDFGVLHNFVQGESVSDFDRVNIPRRFYEYELAHIIPIILKGTTVVMEKIFKRYNCGAIIEDYKELNFIDNNKITYYVPTHKEMLNKIYKNKSNESH